MTDTVPTERAWARTATVPRLLPPHPLETAQDHTAWYGPRPDGDRALIGEVDRSGLRGRGGAGFPTAVKLAAVANGRRRPIVVANGTEGEPASSKDKVLLYHAPHLVLDGAALAGEALDAREVVVCVDRSGGRIGDRLRRALDERNGSDRVPIRIAATPDRYLTGEESALVHWLNGGDAKPTLVPPRPFERGVQGRPTLVQNVETLAHLALIARFGAEWYRAVGTHSDPGTALVTVSGSVARAGVNEVALGVPIADILAKAGASHPRAVLVGGYFGTWLAGDELRGVTLSPSALPAVGASFGCGALVVVGDDTCGLAESARVARWLADQTAGQCGPCVHGLDAIAGAMARLAAGDPTGKPEAQLRRWLDQVKGRGACKHPDGAARFVESSLRVFGDEIARHRQRGPCPKGPWTLPVPAPGPWR